MELLYDPAIPLLGIYPVQNCSSKRYMNNYVYSSTIYNSEDMEQPKCPLTDKLIKKMWYIFTVEYYPAIA